MLWYTKNSYRISPHNQTQMGQGFLRFNRLKQRRMAVFFNPVPANPLQKRITVKWVHEKKVCGIISPDFRLYTPLSKIPRITWIMQNSDYSLTIGKKY